MRSSTNALAMLLVVSLVLAGCMVRFGDGDITGVRLTYERSVSGTSADGHGGAQWAHSMRHSFSPLRFVYEGGKELLGDPSRCRQGSVERYAVYKRQLPPSLVGPRRPELVEHYSFDEGEVCTWR